MDLENKSLLYRVKRRISKSSWSGRVALSVGNSMVFAERYMVAFTNRSAGTQNMRDMAT